jgi:hypothetical protein
MIDYVIIQKQEKKRHKYKVSRGAKEIRVGEKAG